MEHPPKQGLKQTKEQQTNCCFLGFNGTSTKTRIETFGFHDRRGKLYRVLMEHPPKQGLKLQHPLFVKHMQLVLMEHPPKQGLKLQDFDPFEFVCYMF